MDSDLFGHPTGGYIVRDTTVTIRGNPTLERACNRLLAMIRADKTIIDGTSMAIIDKKIFAELVWQDCFQSLISADKKPVFLAAMLRAPEQDVFTRARRELLSRDIIRVSSKAVKSGEQYRNRISRAMGGGE